MMSISHFVKCILPHIINIANLCYYGLYALQHRGQESCGIVANDDIFTSCKDLVLVNEVFTNDALCRFPEGNRALDVFVMARRELPIVIIASQLK